MNQMHSSPPYPLTTAALGGVPTIIPDVPICAILLALYLAGAASHMTIFQLNKRRGHKFLISGMCFGFCMSRIVTMIMRIVWTTRPTNVGIAVAAGIFVSAGVVLLFVINILFAQRIVRACHPHAGWHWAFHYPFIAIYVLIVANLITLITVQVVAVYTLDTNAHRIIRDLQLYAGTFYAVVSFLPFLMVLFGLVIPRRTRLEKFGQGRFRTKIAILLTSAFFLGLGACYRIGVNYVDGARPRTHPTKAQGKGPFYVFNFVVELIVIYLYVLVRIDKRFFVPNGSHHAGDYAKRDDFYSRRMMEKGGNHDDPEAKAGDMIMPEEEVFDDMSPEEVRQETMDRGAAEDEEKEIESNQSMSVANERTAAAQPRGFIEKPATTHAPREMVIEMSRE